MLGRYRARLKQFSKFRQVNDEPAHSYEPKILVFMEVRKELCRAYKPTSLGFAIDISFQPFSEGTEINQTRVGIGKNHPMAYRSLLFPKDQCVVPFVPVVVIVKLAIRQIPANALKASVKIP